MLLNRNNCKKIKESLTDAIRNRPAHKWSDGHLYKGEVYGALAASFG